MVECNVCGFLRVWCWLCTSSDATGGRRNLSQRRPFITIEYENNLKKKKREKEVALRVEVAKITGFVY